MKYFISQPMVGKSSLEIKVVREHIKEAILVEYPDAEFINDYITDSQYDTKPVWQLGRSISLMSEADKIVFAPGWEKAKESRMEHIIAKEYGYGVID